MRKPRDSVDRQFGRGLQSLCGGGGAVMKITSTPSEEKLATAIERLDRPPPGWFVISVMRRDDTRKLDWVTLMTDVHLDDLKRCTCDFPALFYVHPDDYRPGSRTARQCWVNIRGKHRNIDAAWDALEAMMATRH